MSLRGIAKTMAYRSGALGRFRRILHGESLTVVMFHRVLPEPELLRSGADREYAISPELLADVAAFLTKNYTVVGLHDVLASLARTKPLPREPLLITFDDGWRDNLEWAHPVLRGLPWALFVAADAIAESGYWWQEVLLWALRSNTAIYAELWENAAGARGTAQRADPDDMLALLLRYGELPRDRRDELLAPYESELRLRGEPRHMLSAPELEVLRDTGVAIGSHGASHLPLSRIADPAVDLARAKVILGGAGALPALSFPHGRYNARAMAAARELNYAALFTSDPVLNPCPGGWLASDRIGRIPIDAAHVLTKSDRFAPERLATRLVLRERTFGAGVAV